MMDGVSRQLKLFQYLIFVFSSPAT